MDATEEATRQRIHGFISDLEAWPGKEEYQRVKKALEDRYVQVTQQRKVPSVLPVKRAPSGLFLSPMGDLLQDATVHYPTPPAQNPERGLSMGGGGGGGVHYPSAVVRVPSGQGARIQVKTIKKMKSGEIKLVKLALIVVRPEGVQVVVPSVGMNIEVPASQVEAAILSCGPPYIVYATLCLGPPVTQNKNIRIVRHEDLIVKITHRYGVLDPQAVGIAAAERPKHQTQDILKRLKAVLSGEIKETAENCYSMLMRFLGDKKSMTEFFRML